MFALSETYSKCFQRNILHEDRPYCSAIVVYNMAASFDDIISLADIPSTKEIANRYRISRVWNPLSALSGIEVTGPAAEFTILVSIRGELLSAMLTSQIIIGLFVDLVLVVVPVGHTASVRTEPFLPAASGLFNGSATLQTYPRSRNIRVTAYV